MTAKEHLEKWGQRAKLALISAILIGIGFVVGAYMVAPTMAKGQEGYLPTIVSQMPVKVIQLTNPDGSTTLLPVRIAGTTAARNAGLREVGSSALDNLLLLYVHTRAVSQFYYQVDGIRAPLELAIIDADGKGVAIEKAALGASVLRVSAPHSWALAAKNGLLSQLGIEIGSVLNVDVISASD